MGKFKGGKKPVKKVVKKKLSNPCAKNNGAFKFVARMHKSKICYNKAAYAKSGSGPCGSWFTLDVKVGSGCGNNKMRLCPSVKKTKKVVKKKVVKKMTGKRTCKQALNGFVHGAKQYKMKICYNKASYAKAGSGPCGTWCTLDVKVGGGCGNNKMRLCKFKGGKKPVKKVVKKKLSNPCAKNNGAFKFV